MRCDECGERMQRQIDVRVTRGRIIGRSSAIQPAWYCWTCKASTADRSTAGAGVGAEAAPAPRWAGFGGWRAGRAAPAGAARR